MNSRYWGAIRERAVEGAKRRQARDWVLMEMAVGLAQKK